MRRHLLLPLAAVSLGGCRSIDPAPKELDALVHWMWSKYEEGADEELAEGLVNLYDAVDGDAVEDAEDGTVSALSKDAAAQVGVTDRDPSEAPGVYLVNAYACTLDQLEPILLHKAQDELYEGVYDRYDREYTSPRADFESRAEPFMSWTVEYDASILGAAYTANIVGGLRHVPALDDERSPYGPLLMARTYLPEPAAFESDNKSQEQDYQIEIWTSRGDGTLLHVYGLWRQADFGAGITSEDEGTQRLLLNSLADWDDTTEEHCAAGRP